MGQKQDNDKLYIIQSDLTGMIKIGRSRHPQKRLKQLQTGNPNKLKLINLKGKTTEKLGLIGKEKAIACEVICSLSKWKKLMF